MTSLLQSLNPDSSSHYHGRVEPFRACVCTYVVSLQEQPRQAKPVPPMLRIFLRTHHILIGGLPVGKTCSDWPPRELTPHGNSRPSISNKDYCT